VATGPKSWSCKRGYQPAPHPTEPEEVVPSVPC
jgi:hypothetical protein